MILKWLKELLTSSKEDIKLMKSIDQLFEEYDVKFSGGVISKTSKPKYAEKHRQMDRRMAKRIKEYIDKSP